MKSREDLAFIWNSLIGFSYKGTTDYPCESPPASWGFWDSTTIGSCQSIFLIGLRSHSVTGPGPSQNKTRSFLIRYWYIPMPKRTNADVKEPNSVNVYGSKTEICVCVDMSLCFWPPHTSQILVSNRWLTCNKIERDADFGVGNSESSTVYLKAHPPRWTVRY